MTAAQITVKSLDFRLEPWRIDGETLVDFRISPIPGTWTLAPEILLKKGIKGLISCPRCHQAALIRYDMGTMVNGVLEIQGFSCAKCGFACHPRLLEWDRRKLFCIAYEIIDQKSGLPMVDKNGDFTRKQYTHALSREEAFTCFVETRAAVGHRFRVIDVGPVVGFFGLESDKNQTDLTV